MKYRPKDPKDPKFLNSKLLNNYLKLHLNSILDCFFGYSLHNCIFWTNCQHTFLFEKKSEQVAYFWPSTKHPKNFESASNVLEQSQTLSNKLPCVALECTLYPYPVTSTREASSVALARGVIDRAGYERRDRVNQVGNSGKHDTLDSGENR